MRFSRTLGALALAIGALAATAPAAEAKNLVVETSDFGGFIFFHSDLKVFDDRSVEFTKDFMRGSVPQQVIQDRLPLAMYRHLEAAVAAVDWAHQGSLHFGMIWDIATVSYSNGTNSFSS